MVKRLYNIAAAVLVRQYSEIRRILHKEQDRGPWHSSVPSLDKKALFDHVGLC